MKKLVPIIIIVVVLLLLFIGRWPLNVGSDCVLEPYTEESQVLYAQTPGVLTVFNYRSGDLVRKGATIGELTNIELQDSLEQVLATIKETEVQQLILERQINEKQQEVVSAGLRKKKTYAELSNIEQDVQSYNNGKLPPELIVMKIRMEEAERDYEKLKKEQESIDRKKLYPPSIQALANNIEQARIQQDEQLNKYEKSRYLSTLGAISQFDYETSRAQYEIAQQDLATTRSKMQEALENHKYDTLNARDNYIKTKNEYEQSLKDFFLKYDKLHYDNQIAGAEIQQTVYSKETSAAQLQETDEQLSALKQKMQILNDKKQRLTLLAPISGVIIESDITNKIGKHFDLGEKICEVAGLDKLLVSIQVDEKDIGDVKTEMPVKLKVRPFMGSLFQGKVKKISPVSVYNEQKKRNYYNVELVIDNPEGKLKPGMTGFAKINAGSRPIYALLMREIGHLIRSEYWFY
jgi:multidrug efflux pump subunit AcrA (membrane-fusion protein)